MDRFGGVILGESLDTATVGARTLLGVESHGSMSGRGKLTMRLKITKNMRLKSPESRINVKRGKIEVKQDIDLTQDIRNGSKKFRLRR